MFRRADLGHSPNIRFAPIAEVTGLINVGGRDSGRAARLETQPKNPAAWKQLLRSRKILGQEDAAKADMDTLGRCYQSKPTRLSRNRGGTSSSVELRRCV